jgi:ppGpp synthetase/RelA/SpoT-type nucleotidyltranferase
MDFEIPKFSRGEIDKAGNVFAKEEGDRPLTMETAHAIMVISNWRASHSYPMQIIRNNLANRAKKVSSNAIVAQRLKRFESIVSKLAREPRMKLSQMQDLGGCRAIMPTPAWVDELVRIHQEAWDKAPSRHELHRCKDYIASPKLSGYRGVHLIYKFRSDNPDRAAHNGQRIEVQIRSRLQHVWATAVE